MPALMVIISDRFKRYFSLRLPLVSNSPNMSTLVIVRKENQICMASESLTTFGSKKQRSKYIQNSGKMFKWNSSYVGVVGYAAHNFVLQSLMKNKDLKPTFRNPTEIFEFFRDLQPMLKEKYYLQPEDDEDDPYESLRMDLFIANEHGMFSVYALREVWEYKNFWSLGSGSRYSLGAMFAVYNDKNLTAVDIAKTGVSAGIEFDDGCDGPIVCKTIELKK